MNVHDPFKPLRELVLNAADAVRARRVLEGRADDWGEICVTLGRDADGAPWLEVSDTGLGMSPEVLELVLPDRDTPFWRTALMQEQWPALHDARFETTGQLGCGFFSVFDWGGHVRVVSQRCDTVSIHEGLTKSAPEGATWVLELEQGIPMRQSLRPAREDADDERIGSGSARKSIRAGSGGGTRVRLWLHAAGERCILPGHNHAPLLVQLAPCMDVTLKCVDGGGVVHTAVRANDWLTIPDAELLQRLAGHGLTDAGRPWQPYYHPGGRGEALPPLLPVREADGRVVGRAALWQDVPFLKERPPCHICIGGWRVRQMDGFLGIWTADPAARLEPPVMPTATRGAVGEWARHQRDWLYQKSGYDAWALAAEFALRLADMGAGPDGLTLAWGQGGWLDREEIIRIAAELDEMLLVSHDLQGGPPQAAPCPPHMLWVDIGSDDGAGRSHRRSEEWPATLFRPEAWPSLPQKRQWVLEAIAGAWGAGWESLKLVPAERYCACGLCTPPPAGPLMGFHTDPDRWFSYSYPDPACGLSLKGEVYLVRRRGLPV